MKRSIFPPGIFTLLSISLLILLLCALTDAAHLALGSTRSAEALAQSAAAYYQGEAALQQTLARVDEALLSGEDPARLPGVVREENRLILSVSLPEGRQLRAELTLTGPDTGTRYRLSGYALLPG